MPAIDALQELVDDPNETLDIEYKTWLDLRGDTEARADLARHIAALANHGGGKLVIGFHDDMTCAGTSPFPALIDRDLVAAIVKKYLDPTFQCDVRNLVTAGGVTHPIVVVPPHGSSPICAKAGGPLVDGKSRGISQGVYYTRKPGPESAPIATATEWAPIIRRCALHERGSILAAVNSALRGGDQGDFGDLLKNFHGATEAAFGRELKKYKEQGEQLSERYWVMS